MEMAHGQVIDLTKNARWNEDGLGYFTSAVISMSNILSAGIVRQSTAFQSLLVSICRNASARAAKASSCGSRAFRRARPNWI